MLDSVEAIRFDRVMTNGRTKPILIACERSNGEEIEVIAKFTFGCDKSPDGLVREALAAMLAKDLGLPVPEPVVAHVNPEFIQTIEDAEVVNLLNFSDPLGFGSRKLPDGFMVWTAASGNLPNHLIPPALEILAFDCLLTNADRRIENPNLQSDGRSFAIFDHEYTFMTTLNIGWEPPWKPGALSGHYAPTRHVLFEPLKGKNGHDLTRFCTAFAAISDDRINAYGQAIPPSWQANDSAVKRGVELIANLRDNIGPSAQELLRALK